MQDFSVQANGAGGSRLARLLSALRAAWRGSPRTDAAPQGRPLEESEWLAALSHEMRSPLQAFSGWLEVLRAGELEPEERRLAIEGLQRSLRAQSALADDLLHVSRMLVGELTVERAAVPVTAVAAEAVEVVAPLAEAKGVALASSIAECPPVDGDAGLLGLVFRHLLTNAVGRTPRAGRVRIEAKAEGASVVVRVADAGGPGAGLWRTLERGHRQGGYGRRVMLARHVIERHGGTLEHASTEAGVVFVVRLPLPDSATAKAAERTR